MRNLALTVSVVFLCVAVVSGYSGATFREILSDGTVDLEYEGTESYELSALIDILPGNDSSGVIWHYSVVSGLTQKIAPIGYDAGYVFNGGWYGGGKMFEGIAGNGVPIWEIAEPATGTNEYWTNWGTGTAAAESSDIFYSIIRYSIYNDNGTPGIPGDDWLVSDNNCEIRCYDHSSATPLWTYIGTDSIDAGSVDNPGRFMCSDDGSVLAVGCRIDGFMSVVFFSSSSSVPISVYEDPSVTYLPRQIRLTEDGSKCIFRTSVLYRVDTATGVLEDSYNLGASTDCFGVSSDGSVVAYGFTSIRVAVWDGSAYNLEWSRSVSGYYAGGAAVADDNSTIYFGCYKSNYLTNRITRHDISSSSPLWTYDYPTGGGGYQDIVEWMECSEDGRWLVIGSWGCQTGGGPEVCVIDDLYPSTPAFTIDTPGSIFHVDITPDGNYISASGKHVHANQMGSGADVYFAEIDQTGIEGGSEQSYATPVVNRVYPNPACGSVAFSFVIPDHGQVSLDIFDISGHRVMNLFEGVLVPGEHDIAEEIDLGNGLYFYRLSTRGGSAAGKLVISR